MNNKNSLEQQPGHQLSVFHLEFVEPEASKMFVTLLKRYILVYAWRGTLRQF